MKRKKPMNLYVMDVIKSRGALPHEFENYRSNLEFGYRHECHIDDIIDSVNGPWLIIKGFSYNELFEDKYQIDTILLTGDEAFLHEIKAYRTDVEFRNDFLINGNGTFINNPLTQAKGASEKFTDLLTRLDINLKITYYVIIATEGGIVYDMPRDTKILLRDQVRKYAQDLATTVTPANNRTQKYFGMIDRYNVDKSNLWPDMPRYRFDNMRKGIYFTCCGKEVPPFEKYSKIIRCQNCDRRFNTLELTQKELNDYRILFNDEPTIKRLHDWIGGRILIRNLYNWRAKGLL